MTTLRGYNRRIAICTPHPFIQPFGKYRLERPEIAGLRLKSYLSAVFKFIVFQTVVSILRPERPERPEMRGYAREDLCRGSGGMKFIYALFRISGRSGRSSRNPHIPCLFSVGCKNTYFIFSGRSP
jgi:hypothetical protein